MNKLIVIAFTVLIVSFFIFKPENEATAHSENAKSEEAVGTDAISSQFELIDQNGEKKTNKDFIGKKLLVFFGFTYCPDVCPVTMAVLSETMKKLDANKVQVLFISVDPENDTPSRLKEFLKDYDKSIIGLTGSIDQINSAKKAYRVYAEKMGERIGHTDLVYLIDENGKYLEHFTNKNSSDEIAAATLKQ